MNNNSSIPIVILHRNDGPNLRIMIDSIIHNTRFPYEIYIIDNYSNDTSSLVALEDLSQNNNINIIRSNKNNWIFGFNLVFKHPAWKDNYQYYIFSDPDIEVPKMGLDNKCWLETLVNEMDTNISIGKLGISLSLDGIDKGDIYEKIVSQENKHDTFPNIGSNKVCPVDTTLAIYRTDFFVFDKFKFNIGHASLARPYYYTCRTSRLLQARHLGWYNRGKTNNTQELLPEKIKCFAKYAAFIEPVVLENATPSLRVYYRIVHALATYFWGLKVLTNLAKYYYKNLPRNVNQIQNHYK